MGAETVPGCTGATVLPSRRVNKGGRPMGKFEHFEKAISHERFGRYLAWSNDNRDAALSLYAQNTRLSEALYTPLQTLEVVLRNRIHAVLSERCGSDWFQSDLVVGPYQVEQVQAALENSVRAGKSATPGRMLHRSVTASRSNSATARARSRSEGWV